MLEAGFLTEQFAAAKPYDAYVATGTDEQQRRWKQVYDATKLTGAQRSLLGSLQREMNVLIVSGIWCGDCVQQCPLLQRIAEAAPEKIHLRLVDRDEHKELSGQVRINGGDRVPVAIFMAEDFAFCGALGDRTLHRYRAIAQRQLGAACPIALAPPDQDELAATLNDWVQEFERVHLMLRVSPRLRQKHGD